ncbi:hypothetical protein BHU72_10880 [Desulfuribacillus stibiiarsenatis]|uniref:DUF4367 domain-containing protein n=1 Tax=Desulfuribacillus stibiiarsenatis TaxID=1390249 RepID=A0A1E5L2Z6_9FIRM|nr:hypothetical protein [Desulfuribacillus stibiiarsenatis]OEH84309.1 hypothetical protein BHU72_10880 [Desulfuribacillus stibiiarsenatis]
MKNNTVSSGIFVIILMFAIVYFSVYNNPAKDSTNPLNLSEEIAGFRLEKVVSGNAAKVEIERLHGTRFPMEDAFIYHYKQSSREATIWITTTDTPDEAAEQFQVMNEKMQYSQVFLDQKMIGIDNYMIAYVSGMGMDHYYYAEDNVVVWIAVHNDAQADYPFLREFLSYN